MSSAQTGTKSVREINKNFKYYKWNTNEKSSNKKSANQQQQQPEQQPQTQPLNNTTTATTANQLSLGKTYKYNLNMSFIKLYYNNERAIFQTPMLFVPYSPRKGEFGGGLQGGETASSGGNGFKESYYLTASLFNDEYDSDVGEFEKWVNDLEVQTLKLLRKRPYLNAAATGKTPLLKFDDYRGCQKLNLKFERGNAKFYVIEGKSRLSKSVPFQEIATPCYAVFIIELGGIWIRKHAVSDGTDTETEWGINLILHGAQCTPSHTEPSPLGIQPTDFIYNQGMANVSARMANTAAAIPPPPPPPPGFMLAPTPQINPILAPYLKMLKLGIPRDAVRQKMMLAGDDPTLLDNPGSISAPPSQSMLGQIPPPPMVGILNTISTQGLNDGAPRITSDMLAMVRLKKADTESQQHQVPKKQQTQQQGFKVDLSDILAIKSRLKSRAPTEDDKDSYSKIFKKE